MAEGSASGVPVTSFSDPLSAAGSSTAATVGTVVSPLGADGSVTATLPGTVTLPYSADGSSVSCASAVFVDALTKDGAVSSTRVTVQAFDTAVADPVDPVDPVDEVNPPAVIHNFVPLPGTTLVRTGAFSFDVLDNDLRLVGVSAYFPDLGLQELVYDGAGFAVRYAALSARTQGTTVESYTVRRTGGFPSSRVQFRIYALDAETRSDAAVPYSLIDVVLDAPTVPAIVPELVTPSTEEGRGAFYGCALIRPFRRDQRNSYVVGCDAALVESIIGQIIGTRAQSGTTVGELPWRPEFGSKIHLLRHLPNDAAIEDLADAYVVNAVSRWSRRIAVKQSKVERLDLGIGGRNVLSIRPDYIVTAQQNDTDTADLEGTTEILV